MTKSRIIFIIISLFIIIRLYIVTKNLESTAILTLVLLLISSLIWFNDFWTGYILPFGFWAAQATDFKTPGNSSSALVFLAWIFLLLIGWAVF